jgi:catechol 2,3-dioxygenase-like lactoylglutathione lyase family enzyme
MLRRPTPSDEIELPREDEMTLGLHHVALTVSDIDASIAWYKDVFEFEELLRDDHYQGAGGYAVVVGYPDWSMAVVLNSHPTNKGEVFDPTRTGLDHVGFVAPDRATLVEWEERLSNKGVKHSPISDHDFGSALNFRDPDDMQLQIVAFAGSGGGA